MKKKNKINCNQTPRKISFNMETGIGRMCKNSFKSVHRSDAFKSTGLDKILPKVLKELANTVL